MKKILAVMIASAMLFAGCTSKKEKEYEEIEKIDVAVSDYVEEEPNEPVVEEPEEQVNAEAPKQEEQPAVTEEKKEEPTQKEQSENKEQPQTNTAPKQEKKSEEKGTVKVEEKAPSSPQNSTPTNYSAASLSGKVICVDAAHGIFAQNFKENIAPGVNVWKDGFKEGTRGSMTTEDDVTLGVALLLKEKLEAKGATVLMTRTDASTDLSNATRAKFANNNSADICIKLHADATQEGGSGMTALVPGNKYIKNKTMLSKSKILGKAVLNGAVSKTGAARRGVYQTSEMAGFNWSKIPVMILELGYMTNVQDEIKLSDYNYRSQIADGIVEGIIEYYK